MPCGLLAALGLLACACGGGARPGSTDFQLGTLHSEQPVRSERPVVCAPGADWITARDGWVFRGVASVACWIEEAPPRLSLEIASPEPPFGLYLSWDGVVQGEPVLVDGRHRFTVAGSLLTPGAHVLTLERQAYMRGDRASPNLHVSGLAAGPDSEMRSFSPHEAAADAFLADFLTFGSAGDDGDRRTGVLFLGSGELTVPGPFPAAASALRIEPENRSAAPAIFTLQMGQESDGEGSEYLILAPGERRSIELPLPRGCDAIRLAVEGAADGFYYFAAPRLKLAAGALDGPPLIVLVTLDTTRRDALGVYGAPPGVTPHLDAFAAAATVYDRAVSTAPWTLPAHASMFTGLYPSRHGAGVRGRSLGPGVPTLARRLADAGYVAAGLAGGRLMAHRFGVGRGFTYYLDPDDGVRTRGDRLTDHALGMLARAEDENLFLFVNYFDPHWTYSAPAPYAAAAGVPAARAALRSDAWRGAAAGEGDEWTRIARGEAEPTPEGLAWLRAAYEAEVRFMDAEVGRLFAELQRRGLWQRALVAVVADHGELLGERGLVSHAFRLDPELVEVPLIVKWPGQETPRRVDGLVSVADLFPSLLAAAGVSAPPGDGLPLAGGPAADGSSLHGRVFYEEHASRVHALQNPHLRLAAHVWGVENRSRRRVVWESGQECAERRQEESREGHWRPTPCAGSRDAFLQAVERTLGEAPEGGDEVAGEVNEEERSVLKALGYL